MQTVFSSTKVTFPKVEFTKDANSFTRVDSSFTNSKASRTALSLIGKKNNMYIRSKRGWKPDDFSHEQSLVFDTRDGLVIFNSCSHGGADNIINEIRKTYPEKKIRALIGGFHICNRTEEEVRELAQRIKDTDIQEIYTGHCTGRRACSILKEVLGDMVHQLSTGLEIEIL